VDIKEGVYTLPVLHAMTEGSSRDELRALLAPGPPDGERLERAIEIVRSDGSIAHAREAVSREVGRAISLAMSLPEGPSRDALVSLAQFLANRCGAKIV
jgi:heptaprenyl diphosphate synthase